VILPGWAFLLLMQTPPAPEPAIPLAKVRASVLMVHGHLSRGRVQQGSGVVIAPFLVATNAHVVEGTRDISVKQGGTTWTVTEVRVDRSRDLCLLTVPGLTAPPVEAAPEPSAPGQTVVVVGFPGGQGPIASQGRLRGIWCHGAYRLLQSDAITLPGNSGGGLFDESGRLLGLTTLTFAPSPRLNFSVPVAWIQELENQPVGEVGVHTDLGLENHGSELLEKLAQDPRNWPAWEVAARQWVRELPKDENAWLALGLALDLSARASAARGEGASTKLLPEAIEAYRRSLSLRKDAKTWNNLGVSLDLLNHFEEAEVAFAEALALDPSYPLAWLNLGCARMNARRFKEAAEALHRGLTFRPDDADAWLRLAHCQSMLGQREAALVTMTIALRYRPLVSEHWLDFGLLLVALGRLEEAREVHTKLMVMNPDQAARLQASLLRAQTVKPKR